MTGPAFPASPFWDWSLQIYGRPSVQAACLALQERHGLDVNLVLFCCWRAENGQRLGEAFFGPMLDEIHDWHRDAVVPLRTVRQRLKSRLPSAASDLAGTVRQRVASVELDAEHLEQVMLSRLAGTRTPGGDQAFAETAAGNLRAYAATSGFAWTASDIEPLCTILGASAAACSPGEARAQLAAICGESGAAPGG